MIGPGAGKRRQKRMVHIDECRRVARDEARRQNLHVTCQHYEFNSVLFENAELPSLRLGASCRNNRNMLEGNAAVCREFFNIAMIRDDDWNVAAEFARLPAVQEISDTVQVLGTEERNPRRTICDPKLPAHVELSRKRLKILLEGSKIERAGIRTVVGEPPFHAHEKEAEVVILVLISM